MLRHRKLSLWIDKFPIESGIFEQIKNFLFELSIRFC